MAGMEAMADGIIEGVGAGAAGVVLSMSNRLALAAGLGAGAVAVRVGGSEVLGACWKSSKSSKE